MSENIPAGAAPAVLPPFRAWLSSNIPAVYDNTMSYYDELTSLIHYLETVILPALNEDSEAVTTLSNLYKQLKSYVENYFDNLDVQEEINNKLDEMADDGTLQEIITTYIQSNVAWTFDTVADMKLATNLVDGSYARTLGFHSLNDGGGALYKITDTGTANEMDVIAIGDLRASLVIGEHANVKQFGAYGDNTHDDTAVLQYVVANFYDVFMPYANYYTLTALNHTLSSQHINCQGNIRYQGSDFAIKFVSGVDCNIYYKYINAPNGGGILIQASNNCGRNRLEIDTIQSDDETFKVTGNYPSSSWYIYGIRWNSVSNYAINFDISNGSTNVYFNRFIFNNMALLAHPSNDTKGILLTNNGAAANCDIQVEFVETNFESVKGIRTTGHVAYLSINNCRISEIADTNWLEFNGYIPHCKISSAGTINLGNIKFINITGGETVQCDCKVYSNGYTCAGGAIFRTSDNKILFRTADKAFHTIYTATGSDNTVGDDIADATVAYVLPSLLRVEDTSGTTTLTVPNFVYNNVDYIIMNIASSTNVTVKYGTRTISHTFTQGKYAIFNSGNFGWYVQLA